MGKKNIKSTKTPLLKKHPELQKRICDIISTGQPFNKACDYVGISTSAFYAWLSRGKEEEEGIYHDFRKAVMKAESSCMLKHLINVQKAAMEGKYMASIWLLENRFKMKNYEPEVQVNINTEALSVEKLIDGLRKTDDLMILKGPVIDIEEGEK